MLGSPVCSVCEEMRIDCPIGAVWLVTLGVQVHYVSLPVTRESAVFFITQNWNHARV